MVRVPRRGQARRHQEVARHPRQPARGMDPDDRDGLRVEESGAHAAPGFASCGVSLSLHQPQLPVPPRRHEELDAGG